MKRLILATASPRRRQILQQAGIDFITVVSGFNEPDFQDNTMPEKYVMKCARGKAESVSSDFEEAVVIGADTIVVSNNRVLGKPADITEAFDYMKLLSGCEHDVYTGICIVDVMSGQKAVGYEKTSVLFRDLSDREISQYIHAINPLDKAGAYAIQGPGSMVVESIRGCYYNVVGLPVARIEKMMVSLNLSLFQYMESYPG